MPFPVAFQKHLFVVLFSLCFFTPASRADVDDEEQADRSASRSLVSHVVIHPDLSATIEERYSVRILRESAIESEAQQELRYQESVEPVGWLTCARHPTSPLFMPDALSKVRG
jgi:hypothetical protein